MHAQDPQGNPDPTAEIRTPGAMGDPRMPSRGTPFDAWNYRPDAGWTSEFDLIGYHIEATDGSIGKVTLASHVTNGSFLVVDTGPWIFGHSVVLPAGTVTHIDHTDRKVFVDRTKEQIRNSPEYTAPDDLHDESSYRDKLGGYYGDTYRDFGPQIPR